MPVNEGGLIDTRTAFVRALFEVIKDRDDNPYQQQHEERQAAAALKAERSARMSAVSKARKGKRMPGSRPFLAAGFATRAAWEEAGSPEPVIPPSKRELIEARIERVRLRRNAQSRVYQKRKRSAR